MAKKTLIALLFLAAFMGHVQADPFNRDEIVSNADWSKMRKQTIVMEEYRFSPQNLTFDSRVPYMLAIKNSGEQKHYFVSEGFFRGIALRKVQTSDGEIKAPYLTAIEVFPGKSVDLYFVPVKEGSFEVTCTIGGHAGKGMVGSVRIK